MAGGLVPPGPGVAAELDARSLAGERDALPEGALRLSGNDSHQGARRHQRKTRCETSEHLWTPRSGKEVVEGWYPNYRTAVHPCGSPIRRTVGMRRRGALNRF